MKTRINFLAAGWTLGLASAAGMSFSQTSTLRPATSVPIAAPMAATAPTAVPSLVPYSGTVIVSGGKTSADKTTITFQMFKEDSGGEPLWIESQSVAIDSAGHYQVQLGATSPNGLPADLFATGEARWLEIEVVGQEPQPRVLLASVPYALKASDSATLGGLPASAFMLAGSKAAADVTPQAVPNGTNVTTTGGGAGYIPEFSGANTIVDSPLFMLGSDLGIGTTSPAATLDVNGTSLISGSLTVAGTSMLSGGILMPPAGVATARTAYPSQFLKMESSVYNSATGKVVNPRFQWQVESKLNDTAAPTATLNLTSSVTANPPTETGFYINPNGTLNFAPGQIFPGTGTGNGTITGVAAGTDLTGGGASGAVTVNLDTTKVPTLAANNTFAGTDIFNGGVIFNGGFSSNGRSSISTTSTGLAVYTTQNGSIYADLDVPTSSSQNGWTIEGNAYNAYSGLYGYGDDKSVAGVIASGNIGVYAYTDDAHAEDSGHNNASTLTAAVYGQAGVISDNGTMAAENAAAIFGDGGSETKSTAGSQTAIVGTTDDATAALFINNSGSDSTVYIYNQGIGDALYVRGGSEERCTIDENADLNCDGTISGSNVTADKRTLTTYGVQSAENWYEDYGSGQLHSGAAQVSLDPDFGQTVNTAVDYHVFLTPKGDCKGLYVTNESANGFEVRELGGGTTSIAFDYKIVAKRKGYEQVRLEDITEVVQHQAERLKRFSGGAHPTSHPAIPPVPQRAQMKTPLSQR